jgi:hypothetical protein
MSVVVEDCTSDYFTTLIDEQPESPRSCLRFQGVPPAKVKLAFLPSFMNLGAIIVVCSKRVENNAFYAELLAD